jgi:hypothetical protein
VWLSSRCSNSGVWSCVRSKPIFNPCLLIPVSAPRRRLSSMGCSVPSGARPAGCERKPRATQGRGARSRCSAAATGTRMPCETWCTTMPLRRSPRPMWCSFSSRLAFSSRASTRVGLDANTLGRPARSPAARLVYLRPMCRTRAAPSSTASCICRRTGSTTPSDGKPLMFSTAFTSSPNPRLPPK